MNLLTFMPLFDSVMILLAIIIFSKREYSRFPKMYVFVCSVAKPLNSVNDKEEEDIA